MQYSFIVPVYNCKEYLSACVNSIHSISTASYEILLIDDGSTDGSADLCDELANAYSNIRVIHQINSGASSARNTGLQAASGELILFIDSDDTLDSQLLGGILSDPRCVQADITIYGICFDYYKNSKCYRKDTLFYEFDGLLSENHWCNLIVDLFEKNALSSSCTKIYKRSIIDANHLELNTSMFLYEDLEFVLRYLSCCNQIWNVPKAVYHYRQTEDEGNAGRRLSRITSIPAFLEPIEKALDTLAQKHPGINKADCEKILQSLHLTLAREKISVSTLPVIRNVCKDYAQWEDKRIQNPADSHFRHQLLSQRVFTLWFRDKYYKVRHRIAVFVKSALHQLRKGTNHHA